MAAEITANGIAEDFNFDEWIIKHQLTEIKPLLIKHNAITTSQLTTTSSEIQSLLVDGQLLTKPHMIPKIVAALNNVKTIIISEQEQNVMDEVKKNLKLLQEIENKLNALKQEHPKSKRRVQTDKVKKTQIAKDLINKTFDNLLDTLKKRKQSLLNQLNNLEPGNDDKDDDDIKDDEKQTDIIMSCQQQINNLRKYLTEQATNYDKLISTNNDRLRRKNIILKMGLNVQNGWNKAQNILQKNVDVINKQISINNDIIVDLDFVVNNTEYNEIIDSVNNLGKITNVALRMSNEQRIDNFEWDSKTSNGSWIINGNTIEHPKHESLGQISAFSRTPKIDGRWKVRSTYNMDAIIGIIENPTIQHAKKEFYYVHGGYGYRGGIGEVYAGSYDAKKYGTAFKHGDVITVIMDSSNGLLSFCVNGRNQGPIPYKIKQHTQYYLAVHAHCGGAFEYIPEWNL